MKIGVNSRIYQNCESGIPYYVKSLYSNVLRADDKNEYVFFQTDASKRLGPTKTLKLPNNLAGNSLFDLALVDSLARNDRVDVFHGTASILPVRKSRGYRNVVTIHDLAFMVYPEFYSALYRAYFGFAIKRSLQNADMVVCDSDSTRADVLRFFKIPEERVETVHLGVNDIFLEPGQQTVPLMPEKYFFSLTTHPKRKNVLKVLDVMARSRKLREFKYVIAGLISKEHRLELDSYIARLGLCNNVLVMGYLSEGDLLRLYRSAEFMVYPSYYEGFGFPVLEAMASFCPVLTSDNSSLVELNPDPEWRVSPDDVEEMMFKMESLVELSGDSRADLVNKNRKFAETFRWRKTAARMINIFTEVH